MRVKSLNLLDYADGCVVNLSYRTLTCIGATRTYHATFSSVGYTEVSLGNL